MQVGLEKCLSCKDGARGKVRVHKGDEYLNGCECPVNTAALELWLTKVNAKNPSILRRQDEDGKIKREDAFNPTTLSFVEGGILAVSGHTAESLLQREQGRLVHTVEWALGRLSDRLMMDHPAHQQAIELLLTEFKAKMANIKS